MEQNGETVVAAIATTKNLMSDSLYLGIVVSSPWLFPLQNFFVFFLYSSSCVCALQFFLCLFLHLFFCFFIAFYSISIRLISPVWCGQQYTIFIQSVFFLRFFSCCLVLSLWCVHLWLHITNKTAATRKRRSKFAACHSPFEWFVHRMMLFAEIYCQVYQRRKLQVTNLQQGFCADVASLHIYALCYVCWI